MVARYTVVQYVPDPAAGERINIGVMAWDESGVHARFITDWRRVRAFHGADVPFLRELTKTRAERTSIEPPLPLHREQTITAAIIENMVGKWSHEVQFTDPRGSLKHAGELLNELAPVFLHENKRRTLRGRTRRAAAGIAVRAISAAVNAEVPKAASNLVKRDEILSGRFDRHRFDVVLKNGKPLAALHALSFEVGEGEYLEREVDATAWTIDDVRKKFTHLPLAVLILQPTRATHRAKFRKAQRLFRELQADVLTESNMPVWARHQAREIAARP
jgi:hypothetical protein